MAIVNTDVKERMIVVDDINDVSGPQNVAAAGFAYGWRASVQSATQADAQRTFVVVPDSLGIHTWQEQVTSALPIADGPLTSSEWYSTSKACWTLLGVMPAAFGGNITSGFPFQVVSDQSISGALFYWAPPGAATVRVTLRNAAGVAITFVDVAVAGTGDYSATFGAAVALTPLTTYWITLWETTGTGYTAGISAVSPARFLVAPQALRGWVRLAGYCFAAGNALPTTLNAETPMLFAPVFV